MGTIAVRKSYVYAFLALLGCFVISDAWLLVHSLRLNAVIAKAADQQAISLPSRGELLPTLVGVSLRTTQPYAVYPGASPPFALLVFREGCHYCEANWKNWDKLFGKGGVDIPVVLVTADKSISQPYRDQHPMLNEKHVILSADPNALASLKLNFTPQTIYVVGGKINKNWSGVLREEEMGDIKKSMSKD